MKHSQYRSVNFENRQVKEKVHKKMQHFSTLLQILLIKDTGDKTLEDAMTHAIHKISFQSIIYVYYIPYARHYNPLLI